MFVLPLQYQLNHTLWVCTRHWAVFYLFLAGHHEYHYGVLGRSPCSPFKYHSHQHSKADHAGRVYVRQHCNSCLPWICWPQLYKYDQVEIYSLLFTTYSRSSVDLLPNRYFVLLLQSTQYAALGNCSFHDNIDNALLVKNTNVTLAGNSKFIHNFCESNFCIGGGGIRTLSSNIAITGNTTIPENLGIFYGPTNDGGVAIYANITILSFSGISNFSNNLAIFNAAGCAISTTSNSVLSFTGTNTFINNSAPGTHGAGGAIFITDNTILLFNGTNNFINNSAPCNYGAGGAISITDNSTLTNNFINNSAPHSGVSGAIATEWSRPLCSSPQVWEFKGAETCGRAMIGKGTPLKTSIFWAYFQMKQQLTLS